MIIRTEKGQCPFAQIDRAPLEDARLSWRAKGILAYLLSKPDGWTVRADDLLKKGTEGRDAVRAAMGELRDCGYAELRMTRGDGGEATGKEWIIHERPSTPNDGKTDNQAFRPIRENETDSNNEKAVVKKRATQIVTAEDLRGYVFPPCLETEDFHAAVEEWRAYKTGELGERFTRRMLTTILEDGIKRGAVQFAADIRYSIRKTWHGIHPEKPVNGTSGQKKEPNTGWGKSDRQAWDHEPMTDEHREQAKKSIAELKAALRGGPRTPAVEPEKSQYAE